MGGERNRPPPSSRVGARVRIKPAHQHEIEALFSEAGVSPIYKEIRADGNVSYWFGKDQRGKLYSMLDRIPLDCLALHAMVGLPTKH